VTVGTGLMVKTSAGSAAVDNDGDTGAVGCGEGKAIQADCGFSVEHRYRFGHDAYRTGRCVCDDNLYYNV